MASLACTVALLVVVYLLAGRYPALAGLAAVVPVKVVAAGLVTWEVSGAGGLRACVEAMLLGQVAVVACLALVWLWIR